MVGDDEEKCTVGQILWYLAPFLKLDTLYTVQMGVHLGGKSPKLNLWVLALNKIKEILLFPLEILLEMDATVFCLYMSLHWILSRDVHYGATNAYLK